MKNLEDVRVVDLSEGPAGGLATMIFADYGADVIKVERPGGDPFRSMASSPMWLRGKRSIELDLSLSESVSRLRELVKNSDVVISSSLTETAAENSCDYASLSELNAALVYCQVTSFGDQGRYKNLPAYEGVVAAKAGRMKSLEGISPTPGPVFAAVQVATHATAQNIVSAVLAALISRKQTGRGELIQTSLLQGLMPYDQAGSLMLQLQEREPDDAPTRRMDPFSVMPTLNYHPVQAKDKGWIQLGNLLPHLFMNFMRVIGLDDVLGQDAYQGPAGRWEKEDRESLRDRILKRMQTKTVQEWMALFVEDGGVAAHPYQTAEDALEDDDIVANGHAIEIDQILQLGPVANLTRSMPTITKGARSPGQDPQAGFTAIPVKHARALSNKSAPLEGITVLELATIIAAPLGASFLADMGARVIKVEPIGGDPFRTMGPGLGAGRCNQGKESIGVDLKSAEGQAIVHGLIAKADILIHNYRPGVPERLGIGYAQAAAIKPDIIYLASNGYGPNGPGANRPSTHPIPGAAMGGAGYQAGGVPDKSLLSLPELREHARRLMRANEVNPDPNTALVVCSAALLGLYHRTHAGVGQEIFVDMFGANAYANFDDFVSYDGKPAKKPLDENLRGISPLYRLYACKEGWVFLGILNKEEWDLFCHQTNCSHIPDPFTQNNEAEAIERLCALFANKTAEAWESLLTAHGIGCVVADGYTPSAFWLKDKDVLERGLMTEVNHPRWGTYLRHGPMMQFRSAANVMKPPALGGEHTEALLRELGYQDSMIAELWEKKLIWQEAV